MITIPIQADLKDASAAIRQMDSLQEKSAKSAEKMKDAWVEAKNAAKEMTEAISAVTGHTKSLSDSLSTVVKQMKGAKAPDASGGAGGSGTMKRPPVIGPQKMVEKMGPDWVEGQYGARARGGDLEAIRYMNAAKRARSQIRRYNGEGDSIEDIINRTRFGQFMGNTFGMPLGRDIKALINSGRAGNLTQIMGGIGHLPGAVGSAAKMASAAGMTGGGIALIAGATLAVAAFSTALKGATEVLMSYSKEGALSGGDPRASLFYGRMGFNPRGAVDSALSSPFGQIESSRAGLSLLSRAQGGNLNSVTAFESMVRHIRSLDERSARMAAERMGDPSLLRTRAWSEDQARRASGLSGKAPVSGMQAAERLSFEWEYSKTKATDALTIFAPAIDAATGLLNTLNSRLETMSFLVGKVNEAYSWAQGGADAARRQIDPFGSAFDDVRKALQKADEQKRIAKATERTAEATERIYREGYSGGGARTRGALPAKMLGEDKIKTANNLNDLRLGLP